MIRFSFLFPHAGHQHPEVSCTASASSSGSGCSGCHSADLHKPIGQDVQEKAPDELRSLQGHRLELVVVPAIPISEGHLASSSFTSLSLEMATRCV